METMTEVEETESTEWQLAHDNVNEESDTVEGTQSWLNEVEQIDLLGNYSEQTGAIFG
jgi:hypothetical protein